MPVFRLDKYLADAGAGTRSHVKTYIKRGLVTVNGSTNVTPDLKINPDMDIISCQGTIIHLEEYEYYLLYKPMGYVSATKDNVHPTVLSLVDSQRKDLFPVGRLDRDTEGLLLITNDGGLAHRLLSPKKHVDKTYYAVVEGLVTDEDVSLFAEGVPVGDEDLDTALPARLSILDTNPEENLSYINVTIQEGKFHQVKRMFQAVGKKVTFLRRISFGTLALPSDMNPGDCRKLTETELAALRDC